MHPEPTRSARDLVYATKALPLPDTKEKIIDLMKHLLGLSLVQEIVVRTNGVSVSRFVDDGEEVVPLFEDTEVDGDFLVKRLADGLEEMPLDPDIHPAWAIRDAMQRVSRRGLRPLWLLAPRGGWVESFFDLPEDQPAEYIFGMKVILLSEDYQKLVVVGSPTSFLSDARVGILVDLGV